HKSGLPLRGHAHSARPAMSGRLPGPDPAAETPARAWYFFHALGVDHHDRQIAVAPGPVVPPPADNAVALQRAIETMDPGAAAVARDGLPSDAQAHLLDRIGAAVVSAPYARQVARPDAAAESNSGPRHLFKAAAVCNPQRQRPGAARRAGRMVRPSADDRAALQHAIERVRPSLTAVGRNSFPSDVGTGLPDRVGAIVVAAPDARQVDRRLGHRAGPA